ncbi:hypothetical protein GCM10022240_29670 [Microbacterium kribbense]|uniref:Crocagin biosynthetic protein CgnE/B domain-containing protein n=1 Tax=Microbacterium kribbense TaxID=433645 RepID=A0ABP7GWM5_9MICO
MIAYTRSGREKAALVDLLLPSEVSRSLFGFLPYHDPHFEEYLARAVGAAPESNRIIVLTLEDDALSHSDQLADLYDAYGSHVEIYRIISIDDHTFATAFEARPAGITARNAAYLKSLMGSHELRIRTNAGTDLSVLLDPKYQWISNRGSVRPGSFVILPAGEVATYAETISGRFVADGAMRVNVTHRLPSSLTDNPIEVEIENSRIIGYQTSNPVIHQFVADCLRRANVDRVGELGFGTNYGVRGFTSLNSHTNERAPGIHLGFGTPNQPETIVPYDATIHLDLVAAGGTVLVDGDCTIDLTNPALGDGITHPPLVRDQDVAGDCCARGCNLIATGVRFV